MTSSGHDVGTSSLINFLGEHLQARGVRLEGGQVLLEMGRGRGAGPGPWWLGSESLQSSGLLTPSHSGLSRCCDSPCWLSEETLGGLGRERGPPGVPKPWPASVCSPGNEDP